MSDLAIRLVGETYSAIPSAASASVLQKAEKSCRSGGRQTT